MWAERLSARSALLAAAFAFPLLVAYALVERGPSTAIALAGLPLIALAAPAFLTPEGRLVMLGAALALPFTGQTWATQPLPIPGPEIYPQDVVVLLAIGGGIYSWLIARAEGQRFEVPWTPILGWPFVLFFTAVVIATLRGHYAYGTPLFAPSMRLAIYAGVVFALVGLTPQVLYRLLTWLLYGGTLFATLVLAPYYIATGTSQTDQLNLSTGGERILGISTSIYCAGALFLGLLSLRLAESPRDRLLHVTMAGLGLFGVALGFGRAVYAAVALVCVLLLVASRSIRGPVLSALPLVLPFLVVAVIFLPRVAPDLVEAAQRRVSAPPRHDANVQWRLEASHAVYRQIREQPLVGVGFGRNSEFFVDVETSPGGLTVPVRQKVGQDPHNGYLYLWAGGGLFALGSFLLILATFGWDVVHRLRQNVDPVARVVLLWTAATLFVFLLNATTGTSFGAPDNLLAIWTLLVLPSVVPFVRQPGHKGRRAGA
jgi:O-antigen ligase